MCCEDSGCRKPEKLDGRPEDCSPEQVKECHGDVDSHPCTPAESCEHPEELEGGSPGECSPEQIRECHGDAGAHPCE
mgnify:CR=1 FL=1